MNTEIKTNQGETFVLECGAEDKPTLVLLHGSMSNIASWVHDVPQLASDFHLYLIDIIGEPGMSAPSRPELGSGAYVSWFDEVFNALEIERFSLAGISLGGWFSLDYSIRRPGRVEKLVLIVPGGIGKQKNVLLWAVPLSLMGDWGKNKVRELILGEPPAEMTENMRRVGELSGLISATFRPRTDQLPIFSDSDLQQLAMPVLSVVAGRDVMLDSVAMQRRLEENVANLKMLYLPEARHFPGSQADAMLEFLTH